MSPVDHQPRRVDFRLALNGQWWFVIATVAGLLIASQPIITVVILGAVMTIIVAALATPLAAIFGLLVLSPLKSLIETEASVQIPLDIGQIGFLLLMVTFLWHLSRYHDHCAHLVPRASPIMTALLILTVIGGLSAFAAISVSSWLVEWLKWIEILLIVLMIGTFVAPRQWPWLTAALAAGATANALVGLYEFLGGSGADHLYIGDGHFRAFGTFGQPNPFGGFMGLILPLAIMAAASEFTFALQWLRLRSVRARASALRGGCYAVVSLILFIAVVSSWSRGAWLSTAAGLAVMGLILSSRTRTGILLGSAALVVLAVLWVAEIVPRSVANRLTISLADLLIVQDVRGVDITPDNYAVVERLAHWQAALGMATASPYIGNGLGNFEVLYSRYRAINWPESLGHAHNYYLNALAETGIVGLVGYGMAWSIIILMTWRRDRHPDVRVRLMLIGLMGSWTYLCVHSLFDNLYVNNLFLHLGVMLGLLYLLCRQPNLQGTITRGFNQFRFERSSHVSQSA